eukprot:6458566-Amphidinium_carterae.1
MSTSTWSRAGLIFTSSLRKRAKGEEVSWEELHRDLLCGLEVISGEPRRVQLHRHREKNWVFTDAAVENDSMTIGGVLVVQGQMVRHYSCNIPNDIKDLWVESAQPITYAESLAALVAKCLWSPWLHGCDVILAVDNIGAQQSLI